MWLRVVTIHSHSVVDPQTTRLDSMDLILCWLNAVECVCAGILVIRAMIRSWHHSQHQKLVLKPFTGNMPSGKLTQLWKITMLSGKTHYSRAIFNGYFDITRGYQSGMVYFTRSRYWRCLESSHGSYPHERAGVSEHHKLRQFFHSDGS